MQFTLVFKSLVNFSSHERNIFSCIFFPPPFQNTQLKTFLSIIVGFRGSCARYLSDWDRKHQSDNGQQVNDCGGKKDWGLILRLSG